VGDGSLFGPVNDRIAAYGLDNAVSLRKNVSHDRVAEVLSSAYALVLPSVIEGLNISMLEAALLSVPTIGSDVPGINDFVKHKSTGLLSGETIRRAWPHKCRSWTKTPACVKL